MTKSEIETGLLTSGSFCALFSSSLSSNSDGPSALCVSSPDFKSFSSCLSCVLRGRPRLRLGSDSSFCSCKVPESSAKEDSALDSFAETAVEGCNPCSIFFFSTFSPWSFEAEYTRSASFFTIRARRFVAGFFIELCTACSSGIWYTKSSTDVEFLGFIPNCSAMACTSASLFFKSSSLL